MHRRWLKWTLITVGGVVVAAFAGLSYLAGGPGNVYGLVRYALPRLHRGELHVGDRAPDVELVSLDGSRRVHLRDSIGVRPLILVFGSYT